MGFQACGSSGCRERFRVDVGGDDRDHVMPGVPCGPPDSWPVAGGCAIGRRLIGDWVGALRVVAAGATVITMAD